jgi:NAD(P)-dependent dehydrogenase (short-subunit alcohol dehydrogenase family)
MSPVALVTGAASGIGRAAVIRLVERGFTVAAIDVGREALDDLNAKYDGKVRGWVIDVRDFAALSEAVAEVEAELGPIVHVLGSAGIARVGPTFEVARADIAMMMEVNYLGVVNLVSACLPRMLERESGEFAVLASITGVTPPIKMAGYGATKAAVVSYMSSLTYEHAGKGVTLACVCPAAVSTPMGEDFFKDPEKRAKSMATTPEKIVRSIEKGLRKRKFMIYPNGLALALALGQRFTPKLVHALQASKFGDLV